MSFILTLVSVFVAALHLCSAAGHENCVSLLLNDYRADRSLKDAKGQLAKDLALKPSILELFK